MKKLLLILFAGGLLAGSSCNPQWQQAATNRNNSNWAKERLTERYADIDSAYRAREISKEKQLELKNEAYKSYSESLKQ